MFVMCEVQYGACPASCVIHGVLLCCSLLIQGSSSHGNILTLRLTSQRTDMPTSSPTTTPEYHSPTMMVRACVLSVSIGLFLCVFIRNSTFSNLTRILSWEINLKLLPVHIASSTIAVCYL